MRLVFQSKDKATYSRSLIRPILISPALANWDHTGMISSYGNHSGLVKIADLQDSGIDTCEIIYHLGEIYKDLLQCC
jgi:hypothetical protein